ncbi:MAG TPA: aminomethyl-transferring glycine dehydrogenase subunit GcvPA [Acidobacteriaceae bacterium]
MTTYTSVTDSDLAAMLAAIGVSSVREIFERQIPDAVRLARPLDLPDGQSEQDVYEHLRALAARNASAEDELCFLGAGMYDHYVPSIVDMLMERSEFLTPYTPYQPEISQGGLQVMFEYQTAICELTGLPVSNASVYEGPSAVASAGYLAKLHNDRSRFVVSAGLHPHTLATLRTYAPGYGIEVVEVGLRDGVTDPDAWAAAIDEDTSAAIFAQPNFYGAVEDAAALCKVAKQAGGEKLVTVAQVDPIVLGVLIPPGECGVDVAVGEGQSLGNRLDFGGPSFGFFAAREAYLRRMPGRIAGETLDVDGRRGFVLTLQTREQHIRREKATSNICTNQALVAMMVTIFLTVYGKGLRELAEHNLAKATYLRNALAKSEGAKTLFSASPRFHEFVLETPVTAEEMNSTLLEHKIIGGLPLAKWYPELGANATLWCATELTTRAQMDSAAEAVKALAARELVRS